MEKIVKEIIKGKKTCYFVSPHLDDAAFSAGGLISYLAAKTKVVVITAFTRAGKDKHSLSALSYAKQCGYKANEIGKLFRSRRKEDKEAIGNLGAKAIHLPFKDAPWREKRRLNIAERISTLFINEFRYIYPTHRLHISKGKIKKDDMKNLTRLEDKLKQIVDDGRDCVVFCPLALGKHVDHVMVREACTNSFPNVIYWEDSPYNLYHESDKEFVKKHSLKKKVFSKNQATRKNIYPAYKTQFGKLFDDRKSFSLPDEKYYIRDAEEKRQWGRSTKNGQDRYRKLDNHSLKKILKKRLKKGEGKGLIFGNFGSLNMGDEAILAAELEELKGMEEVEITVVGRYPKLIEKLHHQKAYSYFNLTSVLISLVKADFIIFGGGGLFCKNWAGILGFLFQLYYLTLFILIPLVLRKKIFVIGVGFYRNSNFFIRHLALILLKYVDYISVRDFHSFNLLKKYGVYGEIKKDLAFNLRLDRESKTQEFTKERRNVGLSLTDIGSQDANSQIVKKVSDLIKKSPSHYRYFFFPLDLNPNYSIDLKLGEEIKKRLSKKEIKKFSIVSHNLHPKSFFEKFKNMDYFIAMRLHAMIFCYRLCIDFDGIGYDEKCFSFLKSIGKRNLDVNEFNYNYKWDN